jgi:hypothetical protein
VFITFHLLKDFLPCLFLPHFFKFDRTNNYRRSHSNRKNEMIFGCIVYCHGGQIGQWTPSYHHNVKLVFWLVCHGEWWKPTAYIFFFYFLLCQTVISTNTATNSVNFIFYFFLFFYFNECLITFHNLELFVKTSNHNN